VFETDGSVNGADGPGAPGMPGARTSSGTVAATMSSSNTLTAQRRGQPGDLPERRRRLFYSAQDYILDRYIISASSRPASSCTTTWAGLGDQDAITTAYNITGIGGSLADGQAFGVIEDPSVQTYADDLTPRAEAQGVLT